MAGVTPVFGTTAIRPCHGRWRGKLSCHMQNHAHVRKRLLHTQSIYRHCVPSSHSRSLPSLLSLCLNRDFVVYTTSSPQFHEGLQQIYLIVAT